jgi:16S rRNA processing protein RimM
LSVGRIAGHRGRHGEFTIRGCGQAEGWLDVRRVWVEDASGGRYYEVEHSRAYRDRLVLKLEGIDDGNQAAGLRGHRVYVDREDAPVLPQGVHYVDELVGMLVIDESAGELGRVEAVIETGGTALLKVTDGRGSKEEEDTDELLIPLAREYVRSIDTEARRIEVRVPRELRELNRSRAWD